MTTLAEQERIELMRERRERAAAAATHTISTASWTRHEELTDDVARNHGPSVLICEHGYEIRDSAGTVVDRVAIWPWSVRAEEYAQLREAGWEALGFGYARRIEATVT